MIVFFVRFLMHRLKYTCATIIFFVTINSVRSYAKVFYSEDDFREILVIFEKNGIFYEFLLKLTATVSLPIIKL